MSTINSQGQEASKLDLTKADKSYYLATPSPQEVEVKAYWYLTISGVSAPEDALFTQAIEAIYKIAYSVKFYYKTQNQDFVVPKMEAQWWVEGDLPFDQTPRENWHWKILIPMPDYVKAGHVSAIQKAKLEESKILRIAEIRYEKINEGKSVQILHLGSYDAEAPSIAKVFSYLSSKGLEVNGYHHEIYLTDPMRTAEEKLKTIIRYPVR